jgi:hypothetical protein
VSKIAATVVLGLVLAPFIIEALALGVAQWADVIGVRFVPKTPLLSWTESKLADCRLEFSDWMSYQFQDATWEPGFALPIIAVLIVIAMRMVTVTR